MATGFHGKDACKHSIDCRYYCLHRAIKEMIELDKYESSAMRVRKTYRVKVPKNLMINSCNLQLNDPVGQGIFPC